MHGELEQAGDRWTLRFSRPLPHPPERVWRAITEAEHLEAWFPQRVAGEWAVGAPLRFTDPGTDHPAFAGEVLACEPPRLLEYRWGTDVLRFEIVPDGSGCTLVLLDTIDELGKAARDGAGWHACLDVLGHHLNGSQPPWTPREHWGDVHPEYLKRFGPEASTIGPPQGADATTEGGG